MNSENKSQRVPVGSFEVGGKEYPINQLADVMFALANNDELPAVIQQPE